MTELNRYRPMAEGREGDFPGDRRGPRERDAARPDAPPLPCPGCGIDLQKESHPVTVIPCGAQEPQPPARGFVERRNGYRWPISLKKVNGSG